MAQETLGKPRKKNTTLRLYFVRVLDDDCGLAVAAYNRKAALKYMWASGDLMADSFIELRAVWVKKANVEGLKDGEIIFDTIDGLKRGVYGWIDDEDCPICGHNTMLHYEGGVVGCHDCLELLDNPYFREVMQ